MILSLIILFFIIGIFPLCAPPGCLSLFALLAVCAGPMVFGPSRRYRAVGAVFLLVAILGAMQQYVAGKALKARLEQLRR